MNAIKAITRKTIWSVLTVTILQAVVMGRASGASIYYWDPASGGNGHTYELVRVDDPLRATFDWNDALAAAQSTGGYLATITSAAENNIIAGLGSLPADGGRYALGGINDNAWITGEPFTYTNWAPGEPNSSQENTIMIYIGGTTPGQWNDLSATEPLGGGYIVEFNTRVVPEPPALALAAIGIGSIVTVRRLQKNRQFRTLASRSN